MYVITTNVMRYTTIIPSACFCAWEEIYMAGIKDELSREAIYNTDRLVFLSDGVYAIALTILVMDIRLPASFDVFSSSSQLLKALMDLVPNIFAYIISHMVALFTPRVALLALLLL